MNFYQSCIRLYQSFIRYYQSFIRSHKSFIRYYQSFIRSYQIFIRFDQSFLKFIQSFMRFYHLCQWFGCCEIICLCESWQVYMIDSKTLTVTLTVLSFWLTLYNWFRIFKLQSLDDYSNQITFCDHVI